jgi:hypothetical protein
VAHRVKEKAQKTAWWRQKAVGGWSARVPALWRQTVARALPAFRHGAVVSAPPFYGGHPRRDCSPGHNAVTGSALGSGLLRTVPSAVPRSFSMAHSRDKCLSLMYNVLVALSCGRVGARASLATVSLRLWLGSALAKPAGDTLIGRGAYLCCRMLEAFVCSRLVSFSRPRRLVSFVCGASSHFVSFVRGVSFHSRAANWEASEKVPEKGL